MKIITLLENTAVTPELKSKHGLCFYIETEQHKILFDLGPNGLFLENAKKLGVKIEAIDTVIISHGHKDHGGALKKFLEVNHTAKVYIRETAFDGYYVKLLGIPFYVGLDNKLKHEGQIVLTGEKCIIDEGLELFSGVTERAYFSSANESLYMKDKDGLRKDEFSHEQSLIIKEGGKVVLVAGCAHSGIVNIQKKAHTLTDGQLDYVITGFHLDDPVSRKDEEKQLVREIAEQLVGCDTQYYTCHCTGKSAFKTLKSVLGEKLKHLSTGDRLEL